MIPRQATERARRIYAIGRVRTSGRVRWPVPVTLGPTRAPEFRRHRPRCLLHSMSADLPTHARSAESLPSAAVQRRPARGRQTCHLACRLRAHPPAPRCTIVRGALRGPALRRTAPPRLPAATQAHAGRRAGGQQCTDAATALAAVASRFGGRIQEPWPSLSVRSARSAVVIRPCLLRQSARAGSPPHRWHAAHAGRGRSGGARARRSVRRAGHRRAHPEPRRRRLDDGPHLGGSGGRLPEVARRPVHAVRRRARRRRSRW